MASISDFCFDEEACQESAAIGEGPRDVLRVCKMVNAGFRAASSIDPLLYPMAYVLQSEAGARAVMGSKIVRAEICSELDGSKRMISPLVVPGQCQHSLPTVDAVCATKGHIAVAHP